MFRHVVVFRYAEGASPEARQAVCDALERLPAQISEIRRYEFGPDAGLAEGNFDFAVVADFDDQAAYTRYAKHPAHQELIQVHIKPILAERVAVQYALD